MTQYCRYCSGSREHDVPRARSTVLRWPLDFGLWPTQEDGWRRVHSHHDFPFLPDKSSMKFKKNVRKMFSTKKTLRRAPGPRTGRCGLSPPTTSRWPGIGGVGGGSRDAPSPPALGARPPQRSTGLPATPPPERVAAPAPMRAATSRRRAGGDRAQRPHQAPSAL